MTDTIRQRNPDEPFLPPIEKPEDPALTEVHAGYQKRFGRVPTPVTVQSARLPPAFVQLDAKVGQLWQICDRVYVVASEHIYNMTNIGQNFGSDNQCDLVKKRKYEHTRMSAENS